MSRRAVRLVTAAVLVGDRAVGARARCGVGFDDEPRALQEEASTTTVASSPSVGRLTTVLYYVREGALVPVEQELPDRSPATLLTALVPAAPPTRHRAGHLASPPGTELLGTRRDGDRLTVDLSSEFDNVVGLSRQQAIGQMVLTVTEQDAVERLEFQVDGKTITVSSPLRGDTTVVDACDFAALLASPDDVADAGLPRSRSRTSTIDAASSTRPARASARPTSTDAGPRRQEAKNGRATSLVEVQVDGLGAVDGVGQRDVHDAVGLQGDHLAPLRRPRQRPPPPCRSGWPGSGRTRSACRRAGRSRAW